ncbi:DUF3558 family protein [Gordonia sp. TBRC 11910]|uniref:DUF3558 family protein n=1 Tax=Gordonia asplenii TaxID=2725283 RepID=A0A848KST6_9ACTN|nr:DUF3558 family protein [Gordonia asplenii]NMO01067.1 DUF3558 family protein [Gordonia asplenii]
MIALASCEVDGTANPQGAQDHRQLSTTTPKLPFSNTFPNRWNDANNGTSYEPCTAVDSTIARLTDVDILSVHDAAAVDHQTARGCVWTYRDDKAWAVTQIVGNSASLEVYRREQQAFKWRGDMFFNGRKTLVSEISASACATHVQSGSAGISTIAQYDSLPTPSIDEICSRAIAFTKATIDKMPP